MEMITLKAADLRGERVILFPGFVSNGCWLTHLDRVTNRTMFASEDLCRAFAPGVARIVERTGDEDATTGRNMMPQGTLVPIWATGLSIGAIVRRGEWRWLRGGWRWRSGSATQEIMIYHGAGVGFVGLAAKHVKLMGVVGAPLWMGSKKTNDDELSCVIDNENRAQATVAIMPFTLGEIRRWLREPVVVALVESDDEAARMNDDAAAAL